MVMRGSIPLRPAGVHTGIAHVAAPFRVTSKLEGDDARALSAGTDFSGLKVGAVNASRRLPACVELVVDTASSDAEDDPNPLEQPRLTGET